MKLTDALKAHVVKTFSLPADASDELIRKTIGEKIAANEFDPAEIPASAGVNQKSKLDEALSPLFAKFADLEAKFAKLGEKPAETTDEPTAEKLLSEKMAKLDEAVEKFSKANNDDLNPAKLFGSAGKERVKKASEKYSTTKSAAIAPEKAEDGERFSGHPLAGKQVRAPGSHRKLDLPSDLDKAVVGAYWKMQVASQWAKGVDMPPNMRVTDHDRELVAYAMHEMEWTGDGTFADGEGGFKEVQVVDRKLKPHEIKSTQLLDDGAASSSFSLSGGSSGGGGGSLVPLVFDDAIVTIPVLYGELFPLVDLKMLAQGRRVVGAQVANPNLTWGTAEGTAITPFTTTNFVTELDTTVYPIVGAFELGLDFQEDTPVDIGGTIIEIYGRKHLEALDNVIAIGNGTTQPQGVIGSSGITAVASALGSGGPMVVGDLESLMFGVPKATRNAEGGKTIYFSNDTMYRRVRAIPQGEHDARRVFGMDHASYRVMDRPFKVQNDIADGNVVFANMAYYRMWRRRGMTVNVQTAGQTLSLKNTQMIIVRARYGGRPVLGSAFAAMSDAAIVDG